MEENKEGILNLKLSHKLLTKLCQVAKTEGIAMEQLAAEFLAESVVLRAWEIADRGQRIRVEDQQRGQHPKHRNGNQQQGSFRGGRGFSAGSQQLAAQGSARKNSRYQNIMEDGAHFLEYVRSQERNNP